MSEHLILTGLKKEFANKKETNVFLGSWVKEVADKSDLSKNYKINSYHWSNYKKVKKDYDYLTNLYKKILTNLASELNDLHNLNFNKRYWEIILGYWLVYIISILWDRWENIDYAFKQNKIKSVSICENDLSNFKTKNFSRNWIKYVFFNKNFNHLLFSEIIKFRKFDDLDLDKFSLKIEIEKKDLNKNRKYFLNYIFKFLNNIFKDRKVLFFQTHFNIKKYFTVKFFLKNPIIPLPEFDKENFYINYNTKNRLEKLSFPVENEFEKFLKENLYKLVPQNLTTGFQSIREQIGKIRFNPETIFTMFGHITNDFFKIWLAEKVVGGKKLIICEHGGNIKQNDCFNFLNNIADILITHSSPKNPKEIQLPPTFLSETSSSKKKTKLLFLSYNQPLFPYKIHDGPLAPEMPNYISFSKRFLSKLDENKKDVLIFRQGPVDSWQIKNKFKNFFGEKFISKEKNFYTDLKKSKLVINTSFQTTYIQTMYYGNPTLLLLFRNLWNVNDKFENLYEIMLEKKLIFTDIDKAINHINYIWEDPNEWWESHEIKKIREEFKKKCAINHNKQWKNFFNNLTFKKY